TGPWSTGRVSAHTGRPATTGPVLRRLRSSILCLGNDDRDFERGGAKSRRREGMNWWVLQASPRHGLSALLHPCIFPSPHGITASRVHNTTMQLLRGFAASRLRDDKVTIPSPAAVAGVRRPAAISRTAAAAAAASSARGTVWIRAKPAR